MIKSFYEEPIFSSDFQRKDLQVIDKSIQQLLDKNNGVGVVGGFYTPGLPVGIISELALRSLGCHGDEVFGSGYTMQFADCFAEDCDLRDLENFRQFKGSVPSACTPGMGAGAGFTSARTKSSCRTAALCGC